MGSHKHVMVFAGEYSGNIYGAALARELKKRHPGIRLSGTGCREMAECGVEILHDSSSWGGIGFVEALRVLPRLYLIYRRLCSFIERERPDALVLIDYPGFNMYLARLASRLGIPALYYFPPGKFARKPEEVMEAATIVSSIAAPFRFTYDLYLAAGAKRVEYVGHPLADVLPLDLSPSRARNLLGISPEKKIIGLLPGSRRREIRAHVPMLVSCARNISSKIDDCCFVVPVPDLPGSRLDDLTAEVERIAEKERRRHGTDIRVLRGLSHETMIAAEVVVISSGTATLEAVWFRTPMVIIYKASWLTEFLARRFFYSNLPDHFGLPNIIAGREVVPEYIQDRFTEANITGETLRLLQDESYRQQQQAAISTLKKTLARPGTSGRVADMVLDLVDAPGERTGVCSVR